MSALSDVAEGRRVLRAEAGAILAVEARLGEEFDRAVRWLDRATVVHFLGIGKSGHIARKLAGTFASTGTPAQFLHPTEALHGELGNVMPGDALVCISRSGECEELLTAIEAVRMRWRPPHGKPQWEECTSPPFIALTGVLTSRLAKAADIVLDCAADEACPLGLAPTSSTAASMAMGDALAMVLMKRRGFTADDFRETHPGGVLGKV